MRSNLIKAYCLNLAISINLLYILVCVTVYLLNIELYGNVVKPLIDLNNDSNNHPIALAVYALAGVLMYLILHWQKKNIPEWRFWIAYPFALFMFTALPVWVLVDMLITGA